MIELWDVTVYIRKLQCLVSAFLLFPWSPKSSNRFAKNVKACLTPIGPMIATDAPVGRLFIFVNSAVKTKLIVNRNQSPKQVVAEVVNELGGFCRLITDEVDRTTESAPLNAWYF